MAKFNGKKNSYKGWGIELSLNTDTLDLSYLAVKQNEPKKLLGSDLKSLEKKIDKFESEGSLHKEIDRLL